MADEASVAGIGAVNDLITLYRMKEKYLRKGEGFVAVKDALEKRWGELLSEQPPLTDPCEEVELIAFDYRRVGLDRYRADYLLKINRRLPSDLQIGLIGVTAPEYRDRLSAKRRQAGEKSEVWKFRPSPSSSAWVPGQYLLFSQTFPSAAIPYEMSMYLYNPARKPAIYGKMVPLGWRSGLEESSLLDRIRQADHLIDLYRLEGDCQNIPAARNAFKKKAAELLKEHPLLGAICPEADLVAFDYNQIGVNRYRVDCLFRVNRPIETDCLITLVGIADENHREFISKKRREQGKKSERWSFPPFPPTGDWHSGGFVLISEEVEAQPIPYEMYIHLSDRKNRKAHGKRVYLGWQADPGESKPAEM